MEWTVTLLDGCWMAWAIVWVAGWILSLIRGPRMQRRVGGWLEFGVLAVAAWGLAHGMHGFPRLTLWHGSWFAIPGAVILIAGTVFTLWARVVLGNMWSSAPGVRTGHALQTGGPYAITRHPIYTGMLTMALGSLLIVGRAWIAFLWVVFALYLLIKIRMEERLMSEIFGEQYATYQKQVPRLIPIRIRPGR